MALAKLSGSTPPASVRARNSCTAHRSSSGGLSYRCSTCMKTPPWRTNPSRRASGSPGAGAKSGGIIANTPVRRTWQSARALHRGVDPACTYWENCFFRRLMRRNSSGWSDFASRIQVPFGSTRCRALLDCKEKRAHTLLHYRAVEQCLDRGAHERRDQDHRCSHLCVAIA
jgi:hypothetical protein